MSNKLISKLKPYKHDLVKLVKLVEKYSGEYKKWAKVAKDMNMSNADLARATFNYHFRKTVNGEFMDKKKDNLETKLKAFFIGKKLDKHFNLVYLSDKFEVPPKDILNAINKLKKQNINIELGEQDKSISLSSTLPQKEPLIIDSKKFFKSNGKIIKFGAIADTHLGSKYARADVLNTLYDVFENEGITKVFLAGNMIDGERSFNKYDIHVRGVEGQVKYFVNNFPRRKGIITYFITGDDHEGWYVQDVHINIGEKIQDEAKRAGRKDLIYIGHMERDIVLKGKKHSSTIRIIHAGGGSTYATSYTSQKYAESLQGGEKPRVVLVGHFHKLSFDYCREIYMIQCGATQDQTPFMRKKRIQSHLGGCIVELHQDSNGIINRCKTEFITFFDKKFYKYQW